MVREITDAVAYEYSLVARPAYSGSDVAARGGSNCRIPALSRAAAVAVTLTEAELAAALAVNDTLAARLHPVAVALVERYAPDAPPAGPG